MVLSIVILNYKTKIEHNLNIGTPGYVKPSDIILNKTTEGCTIVYVLGDDEPQKDMSVGT